VESVKEGWFMTLSKFTFQTNKTQDSSFND
jgi:hypothetical protein